ncbi:MAG: repressor LexA [bacterium]|nr:repressor LexA [bacterium]
MPATPPGQTRRQVHAYVRERIAEGAPPTVREVQHHFGFKAVQSARQHLEALVQEGALTKEPGRARGYRLPPGEGSAGFLPGAPDLRMVPLLGRVQAGALTEAIEDPQGYVPVEGQPADANLFALTVRGESMLGAGILPGDTVVVRRQHAVRNGEIVVAQVAGEATVKRLRLKRGHVELHPENALFKPIVLDGRDEVNILGRVVEVRRCLT